jgi:hypothetical protein
LRAIVAKFSPELMQMVRQSDVGDAFVSVPTQKILSQISQGAVKISFGELRQLSPAGTFTNDTDRDRSPVEIPLQEILARLTPGLLSRRPSQKQVSIPPEVTGPFGGGHANITFSTSTMKPGSGAQAVGASVPTQTPVAPSPAPAPAYAPPAYSAPPVAPAPAPRPMPFPSAPSPVSARPMSPLAAPLPEVEQQFFRKSAPQSVAAPVTPSGKSDTEPQFFRKSAPQPMAAPISPIAPATKSDTEPQFFRKPAAQPLAPAAPTPAPAPIAPPAALRPVYSPIAPTPAPAPVAPMVPPSPIAMPEPPRAAAPVAPITPIAPEPEPEPEPIRFTPPPPAPVAAPATPAETRFLTVLISDISAAWPDAVQQEMAALNVVHSTALLPFGVIELAMKQGRIALPWRIFRSWIKPPVIASSSPNDAVVVELPLKIVAPLFLAELKGSKAQKKVAIDTNIPDLFSNRAAGEPVPAMPSVVSASPAPTPVAPTIKTSDTNYYGRKVAEGQPEEPAPVVKKGPSPGTAFLVRYATPNEIVSKAAALDGVDGALIALPDGLLVASQIPSSMNADTVAAFLPQIFSRVTQCTKELRLGDLNNLNFTVGAIPWKIFKVGAIYFAAFGRPGEALPTAALAGIAAELDRKAK